MMQNEKISILMPVYNRANFIVNSIPCILNQTYKNIQLIIYDDGSTDNTWELLQEIQSKDDRIIISRGWKNKGVAYARNMLLNMCNTRYAALLDSDDYCCHKKIELQVEEMNKHPDSLIFCSWAKLSSIKQVPGWLDEVIDLDNPSLGHATMLFPVNKEFKFNETLQFGGEDWQWIEQMKKKYPTILLKKRLYYINFHGNRIGSWKRKIDKTWGGRYNLNDIKNLSYAEAITKYKDEE